MSNERFLSGEEKRARLREKFKQDLLKEKQLREELRRARQIHALRRQVQAVEQRLFNPADDVQDMLERLNQKTAWNEAKLDSALESRAPNPEHPQQVAFVSPASSDPITDALPPHLRPTVVVSQPENSPCRLADGAWHNPEHDIEFPIPNRPKTLGNRRL